MKKKRFLQSVPVLFFATFVFFAIVGQDVAAEPAVKISLGWQVPWAIQGQIVQILKHTNILEKNGIKCEFIGRTYGPELNEIALAGQVDVILTADQPAATLFSKFSKDKGWIGIGRLMNNRTTTAVAPGNTLIRNLTDLKGKKIGVPIGAAAERVTAEALQEKNLDPKKDVTFINIGIQEQGALVQRYGKDAKNWGDIAALSSFDPLPAILESQGLIKVIHEGKVVSMVLMSKSYIEKNPTAPVKLMQSLKDAYDFYRQNISQANEWFMKEAGLKDIDQKACDIAAKIEPNIWVKKRSDIRVTFSEEDFQIMQRGADFIAPMIRKQINMADYVTNEYAKQVK